MSVAVAPTTQPVILTVVLGPAPAPAAEEPAAVAGAPRRTPSPSPWLDLNEATWEDAEWR